MTIPLASNGLATIYRAKQNRYYAKAVAAQPGYTEAVALREKAVERQRALRFPEVRFPDPPATDAGIDAYLDGFTAALDEQEQRDRQHRALEAAIGNCDGTILAAGNNVNPLLEHLAADLVDLVARAEQVDARLDGAATASDAINLGTADAWRELADLRAEYDAIREAQVQAMQSDPMLYSTGRSAHVDDPLASDTQLADLDDVFPGWLERDPHIHMSSTPRDRRPWPQDPIEQFVWIIRHATPWIPTTHQLDELHQQRRYRLDPTPLPTEEQVVRPHAHRSAQRIAQIR